MERSTLDPKQNHNNFQRFREAWDQIFEYENRLVSIFKTNEKERSTEILTIALSPQTPPLSFSLSRSPSLDRTSNRFNRRRIFFSDAALSWEPSKDNSYCPSDIACSWLRLFTFLHSFYSLYLCWYFFSSLTFSSRVLFFLSLWVLFI